MLEDWEQIQLDMVLAVIQPDPKCVQRLEEDPLFWRELRAAMRREIDREKDRENSRKGIAPATDLW